MAVKRLWHRSCISNRWRKFSRVVRRARGFGGEVNPCKTLEGVAVIEGVLEGFVGEAIPLLEKIDAQHPLQSDGRTATFALRIEGFDDGQQLFPRDDLLHAGKELFAAGDFLFGGELGVREAGLVSHAVKFNPHAPQHHLKSNEMIKSVFPLQWPCFNRNKK